MYRAEVARKRRTFMMTAMSLNESRVDILLSTEYSSPILRVCSLWIYIHISLSDRGELPVCLFQPFGSGCTTGM